MPKTKLGGVLPNYGAVSKLIERYIKIERNTTVGSAAERAQVKRSTYYNRMNDPSGFTLQELRSFEKTLKIPREEMAAALAEALKY